MSKRANKSKSPGGPAPTPATVAPVPAAGGVVTAVTLGKVAGGAPGAPDRFGFHVRESRLEYTHMQQDMRGFFNLLILLAALFVASHAVSAWYERSAAGPGAFAPDLALFWALVDGLHTAFPVVLSMVLYTSTAFVLQSAVTAGVLHCDGLLTHAVQHVIQSGLFVYGLLWVSAMRWPMIQTAAVVVEMLVLFMKMHSYLQMNRVFALEQRRVQATAAAAIAAGVDPAVATAAATAAVESAAHAAGACAVPPNNYPHNVTLANYVMYLLTPTLVYETAYPRTDRVRPLYVLEKAVACVGSVVACYFVADVYVTPVLTRVHELAFPHAVAKLLVPMITLYMLVFYIIFEVVCQGFAELTRFADRDFYSDWWNSVTFEEYARKWNKPVHEYLRRHIYSYARAKTHSRATAMLTTFLFSSLLHELVLVAMFRFFRPYFFSMQMLQLPLIVVGAKLKRFERFSNFFFWFGLVLGPAILAIAYVREYKALEAAATATA